MTSSVPSDLDVALAQATFCACLFDELVRGGMREVVVCPGSRSTPLVLASLSTPLLDVHIRLDERSAGFFAIGRALATRRPVGIVVTSGTAAAELAASVVEADLARVPLVVMTADRPPELRGIGASQTIDQVKLFGASVRRYEEPGPIRAGSARWWRPLAARLLASAVDDEGPVHLNLSLVEPLDAPAGATPDGRPDGAPWRTRHAASGVALGPLRELAGRRTLVVAGRGAGDPKDLVALAERHELVLLSDPLSGARAEHRCVVASFDALLRDAVLRDRLAPEAVVLLGATPASKPLADAIASWAPRVIAVASTRGLQDPAGIVSDHVAAEPGAWARAARTAPSIGSPASFLADWQQAEDAAQRRFDLQCATSFDEPSVARLLSRLLDDDVGLVVSSSMPIRDLESFGAKRPAATTVFANRGANGIDGVVSTTLGVATSNRAVGLLGDLAFFHDAGSLADGVGDLGGTCVLVVLDNHGGAIFSFLPQRGTLPLEQFERAFATPPTASVAAVASGYGAEVRAVKDLESLRVGVTEGLGSPGVTVIVAEMPDRDRNVELHRELAALAIEDAKRALGA